MLTTQRLQTKISYNFHPAALLSVTENIHTLASHPSFVATALTGDEVQSHSKKPDNVFPRSYLLQLTHIILLKVGCSSEVHHVLGVFFS